MIRRLLATLTASVALMLTACGVSVQDEPVPLSEPPSPPAVTPTITLRPSAPADPGPTPPTPTPEAS
jgi:hypothetical protein